MEELARQAPSTWGELNVRELRSDRWPTLQIGPIHLEWSTAHDGMGYVYFGPHGHHSDEYEVAVTNEVDITRIDGSRLNFFRRSLPS